ncbi:MAG: TolC family protein [Phenylobacterium sp.]|nr:TolC family protein [Phenylobacterium sp.]
MNRVSVAAPRRRRAHSNVSAKAWAVGAAALLAGCATYSPLPLPAAPKLATAPDQLAHDQPLPPGPLSVSQVTALAVLNNPDLRAIRAQHGVAQAQLIQAGVLPNPTLSFAILPLLAGVGTTMAWTASLTYNFGALVTYHTRVEAAQKSAQQVDADILWREWQMAGQARLLAVDLIEGQRSLKVLSQALDLLAGRGQRLEAALAAGNVTLADAAPYLAARQQTQIQLNDLQSRLLAQRHQLNALLGLTPEAVVPLADTVDLPPLDPAAIQRDLPNLPQRRPDLVALQLGYAAQDAKLRTALLMQFPAPTLGGQGSSDNANVRNGGPNASFGLPIFDRNQGGLAIEKATRVQLHEEYAARLAAAVGEVGARLSEIAATQRQLDRARADLPIAEQRAARAEAALRTSDIDQRTYVDLVNARFTRELQIAMLEQTLLDQQVAIDTLVGAGLPSIPPPAQEASR